MLEDEKVVAECSAEEEAARAHKVGEWLRLRQRILRDVNQALDAGEGQFAIACYSRHPRSSLDESQLPPPRIGADGNPVPPDPNEMIILSRVHCYFPYADFPNVIRDFTSTLSRIQRDKDKERANLRLAEPGD